MCAYSSDLTHPFTPPAVAWPCRLRSRHPLQVVDRLQSTVIPMVATMKVPHVRLAFPCCAPFPRHQHSVVTGALGEATPGPEG